MLNKKLLSKKIGDYVFCSYNIFGELLTDLRYYLNDMYIIKNVARNHYQLANYDRVELVDFIFNDNFIIKDSLKSIIEHIEKNGSLMVNIFFKKGKSLQYDLLYLIKHNLYLYYNLESYNSPIKNLITDIRYYINFNGNIPFKENSFLIKEFLFDEWSMYTDNISMSLDNLNSYASDEHNINKLFHYISEKDFSISNEIKQEIVVNLKDNSFLEKFISLNNKKLFNIFNLYLRNSSKEDNLIVLDDLYKVLINKFNVDTVNYLLYIYTSSYRSNNIINYYLNDDLYKINKFNADVVVSKFSFKFNDKSIFYDNANISSLLFTQYDIIDCTKLLAKLYEKLDLNNLNITDSTLLLYYTTKYNYFEKYVSYYSNNNLSSILALSLNDRNRRISEIEEFKIHQLENCDLVENIIVHLYSNKDYINDTDINGIVYTFSIINFYNYGYNDKIFSILKTNNIFENIFSLKNIKIEDYIMNCKKSYILIAIYYYINDISQYVNKINDKKLLIEKINLLIKESSDSYRAYRESIFKIIFDSFIKDYDIKLQEIFNKRLNRKELSTYELNLFQKEIYNLIKKYKILPNI
jgi:hypothetical protein